MTLEHSLRCDVCEKVEPITVAHAAEWLSVVGIGKVWHFCSLTCLGSWAFLQQKAAR